MNGFRSRSMDGLNSREDSESFALEAVAKWADRSRPAFAEFDRQRAALDWRRTLINIAAIVDLARASFAKFGKEAVAGGGPPAKCRMRRPCTRP